MSDDEIRDELEKVKAEIEEVAVLAGTGGVSRQKLSPIDSAMARIDKLLKHFDPDQGVLPLKAKP